jgi:small subunit ribosomal protein S19e
MGIYDVPSKYLIEETSKILSTELEQPSFVEYVKTGMHKERAPQRTDWFYIRMSSIMYRAYKWGNIGTERLRSYYGGRKNRGVKTEHHYKASGKVIRSAVQILEKAGYLEVAKPKGRKISVKGFKLLNQVSKTVAKNMQEGKYQKVKKDKPSPKKKVETHEFAPKNQEKKQPKGGKK